MNREELAWAAGLFEGEGCFAISGDHPHAYLGMTDQDRVEAFHTVMELGRVYARAPTPRYKQVWGWSAQRFEAVQAVLAMLWPWLGPRRRHQGVRTLQRFRSGPGLGRDRLGRWSR